MQSLKLIVFTCIVMMASCSLQKNSNNDQSESRILHVDEKALAKGTLLLHLPEKKPKGLAIQTPNGEWFVLQDHEEAIEIMPQTLFDSVDEMKFNIQTLKGTTWRESVKTIDVIFTSSGKYLIYFADNLETEPENTFSLQEVVDFKN